MVVLEAYGRTFEDSEGYMPIEYFLLMVEATELCENKVDFES